jgi:hypothetical protein
MSDMTQGPASGHGTALATACLVCHTPSPSEPPPFTWSASVERGRRAWTCEQCSRDNIRSIEGKLDTAWW